MSFGQQILKQKKKLKKKKYKIKIIKTIETNSVTIPVSIRTICKPLSWLFLKLTLTVFYGLRDGSLSRSGLVVLS